MRKFEHLEFVNVSYLDEIFRTFRNDNAWAVYPDCTRDTKFDTDIRLPQSPLYKYRKRIWNRIIRLPSSLLK